MRLSVNRERPPKRRSRRPKLLIEAWFNCSVVGLKVLPLSIHFRVLVGETIDKEFGYDLYAQKGGQMTIKYLNTSTKLIHAQRHQRLRISGPSHHMATYL
jgi:hypothetical protein